MSTILYNSAAVRKAIADIFRSSGKRVAITAFVGNGAEAYLPNPRGIQMVCWPKAGGTNPDALRKLIRLGVKIQFSDNLHMKVYWSRKGAVVTSANLSTNALGAGNLKEVGVLLSADDIDIESILKSLRSRPFNLKELKKLDSESQAVDKVIISRVKPMTFLEWYSCTAKRPWRLGWVSGRGKLPQAAIAVARNEFGQHKPHDTIMDRKQSFKEGDYILDFFWASEINKPKDFRWLYADRVVRTNKQDKAYNAKFPYSAVQVFSPRHYSPPFFMDKMFKKAFEKASRDLGFHKLINRKNTMPPKDLIDLIARHYRRLINADRSTKPKDV